MPCPCAILSSVACQDLSHFSHYLINSRIFREKCCVTENACYRISLQLLPEIFVIVRRVRRDITINIHTPSSKVSVLFSDFKETLIFSTDFRKILKLKFHEIRSSGSRVVGGRIDRQTDIAKLIDALRNYANAPTNEILRCLQRWQLIVSKILYFQYISALNFCIYVEKLKNFSISNYLCSKILVQFHVHKLQD
jgi:hypothetical protein